MILYVTSFNNTIYRNSGEKLINSFLEHRPRGTLFVAGEGNSVPIGRWSIDGQISSMDITKSPYLEHWLYKNRDIIPKSIGGEYEGEKQSWWNRNAACWYRKIVALRSSDYLWHCNRYVIWIDADCLFLGSPDPDDFMKWFGGAGCFYIQGPRRKHPETSIMGFDLKGGGEMVLNELVDRYVGSRFREDERWDDCWQLMQSIKKTKIPSTDLFGGYGKAGRVVEYSDLKNFFAHSKGVNKQSRSRMHKKGQFWS